MKLKPLNGYALCIILLLVTVIPVFSQEQEPPMPQQSSPSEDEILKFLDEFRQLEQVNSPTLGPQLDQLGRDIIWFGEIAAKIKSDRIVQEILNFPVHDPWIAEAKVRSLTYFEECPPEAHEFVLNSLYDPAPKVQVAASHALILWEMSSDEVFKVIHELGNYHILAKARKSSEIESFLREGAKTSTWEGRINAAYVLQSYGDTLTIIDVSKEVIRNSPTNTDDKSIARAKYTAFHQLSRHNCTDMISDIARQANDNDRMVRISSVDVLRAFAYNGNQEAVAALEMISNANDDPKLRATAKQYLQEILNK